MRRVEVRCCCEPQELLGTLPSFDKVRIGERVTFPVMKPRTRVPTRGPLNVNPLAISLQLLAWRNEKRCALTGEIVLEDGVAFKADGVPIETLRLIPGFIEAKP